MILMRLTSLIILFVFFNGFSQQEKIKVDSTMILLNDFKAAGILDSLFDASILNLKNRRRQVDKQSLYKGSVNLDTIKKRLAYLDSKTPIDIVYNPIIGHFINTYLDRRRSSYKKLIKRSSYYFPMFEEILDKEGVPLEMKYLSIIESALLPRAKSSAGASGIWQFMFSTGKIYDLEVSSYVDERLAPLRATNAAAKYLKSLYDIFGDWTLAMAAYNSGPGNVTKAIRRSGGYTNFWNIRPFLPKETANYIPAFFATLYIFEYAQSHGIALDEPQFNFLKTDTVQIRQTIHFDHLTEIFGITTDELEFLNPSYKLNIIPKIEGRDYTLRLPLNYIGLFIANEDEVYAYAQKEINSREKPLPKFYKMDSKIIYRVVSGDYLGKIAQKFKVKVSEIKRWNNLKTDNINIGDKLIIYTRNLEYQTSLLFNNLHNRTETNIKKTFMKESAREIINIFDHKTD